MFSRIFFSFRFLAVTILFLFFCVSCHRLESDADRMARKTCECISFPFDSTDPAVVQQCFSDLMAIASELESDYPSSEQQQQIITRYTQTLRQCDAPTADMMIDLLSGEWSHVNQQSQDEIPFEDEK